MTNPDPNPFPDGEVIVCYGGAKPEDEHLASIVHCVDGEIVEWLRRRERRQKAARAANQINPSARAGYRLGATDDRCREVSLRRKSLCGKLLQKSFPCSLRIG